MSFSFLIDGHRWINPYPFDAGAIYSPHTTDQDAGKQLLLNQSGFIPAPLKPNNHAISWYKNDEVNLHQSQPRKENIMSPAVIQVAKAVVVAFFGAIASVFVSSLDKGEANNKDNTSK